MLMPRYYSSLAVLLSLLAVPVLAGQSGPAPRAADPQTQTKSFIDYFLPTPPHGALSRAAWGAPNILPRDPNNGLEDKTIKQYCYWDGQIIKAPDGRYHLFASRWAESRGHNGWFGSVAVHAVSDSLTGPYLDKGLCWPAEAGGRGHNVTALTLPDGRYAVIISETRPCEVYVSKSLDGPWEHLGTITVEGEPRWHGSNVAIMARPDGNFEFTQRDGRIMFSDKGILGPYKVVSPSVWPAGIPNLEDPCLWYSGGLYHILVNSWSTRKAYHLTSPDGIHDWTNRGVAYDPRAPIVRYPDGTVNHWNKLERPSVYLESGHVVALTFAAIDVEKEQDKGGDGHGSKVIVVPFNGAALDQDLQTSARTEAPAPCGPVPSENQMRWQEMEYYAFVHFSLNTYTDQSWGNGNEDVKLFNPTELDCRQWARICKEAGMKGIIVTAKHHCGFCLWPSKYTDYSVKNAPWRDGKGDVVRELAEACKEYGLKLGIYLSPWDRNHAEYGRPAYITYFRNQLTELLTNYGPIFEVWFDGANGGTGYYGGANENRKIDRTTYYDWANTYKLIRKLQPNIVIWNDGGDRGDLRWVGTEAGFVGETNWSLLNATGPVPYNMLHYGVENGDSWVPGEVNTSIRPEWFYHPREDARVKTLPQLLDTYYNSVGRNGTLLLNFPIMPNGLIHKNDEKAALDLAQAVKEAFAVDLARNAQAQATNVRGQADKFAAAKALDGDQDTYWATDDGVTQASLTLTFGKPTTFNRFLAQEYIRLGQRVKAFTVEALVEGHWKELAQATTIGYKRILRFPSVEATQVRFTITAAKNCPVISNIGIYQAPQILTPPAVIRNQAGDVIITPADKESVVYYTTDGSVPTKNSNQYTGPLPTEGKVQVSAIACEPASGKSSLVCHEEFDLPRKDWKLVGIDDHKASALLDGNPSTAWHQPRNRRLPIDLIIDLGKEQNLGGFRYFPDQGLWGPGIITNYEFYVSADNVEWKLVDQGEFSNIKNNPLWQTKTFAPERARYIKLRALRNTENNSNIGYAEVDIITVGN